MKKEVKGLYRLLLDLSTRMTMENEKKLALSGYFKHNLSSIHGCDAKI